MTSFDRGLFSSSRILGLSTALIVVAACSSSSGPATGSQEQSSTCSPAGEASPAPTGYSDTHCVDTTGAQIKQPTDPAACDVEPDGGGDDMGDDSGDDAAAVPADGGPTGDCDPSEFGATMYGQSGADDDCKYDVSWTSTPVCENENGVWFTVKATKRADGTPLTGAGPYIESVQACSHASPTPVQPTAVESPPGTYKIGPIFFDRPGGWVVRFHFFGTNCSDALETSPHGHAAFFVTVP
jgi:hypothetical protein